MDLLFFLFALLGFLAGVVTTLVIVRPALKGKPSIAGDRYEIAVEVEASQAEATIDRLSAKVDALVAKIEKVTGAT